MSESCAAGWAEDEFGHAELGDRRRSRRLLRIAEALAAAPAGRVTQVFRTNAEQQGVYDLLSNERVSRAALGLAMASACFERCREAADGKRMPVVIVFDGSSIGVPDHTGTKDLGVVGNYRNAGRGLQVLTALALTPDGTPVGVAGQRYWSRPKKRPRKMRTHWRKTMAKETQHTLDLIKDVSEAASSSPDLQLVFVGDRGNDAAPVLFDISDLQHGFVIRACRDRLTAQQGRERERRYIRDRLVRSKALGCNALDVSAGHRRAARVAHMEVRAVQVTLVIQDRYAKKQSLFTVNVVHAVERGTTPSGEKPLDWMLLTNLPAEDLAHAMQIIELYALRWRIEEFHRTWKTGTCNVEDSRLHTASRLEKWATLLAAVATRIERLKQLSREEPDSPASRELTKYEIKALLWFMRKYKKRNEVIPDTTPCMRDAVNWIARTGGYTGYGGPPGSVTIARGFADILILAAFLKDQDERESPHEM
jgi:hypothetical protein